MDRKNPKIAGIEYLPKPIKDGLTLVRELIVDKFQPEMIILFGSLATGEWTWKRDIDLLIVADADELDVRNAYQHQVSKRNYRESFLRWWLVG